MKIIQARCLLCNSIFHSYSHDTSNLIEHLKKMHPDINLQPSFSTVKQYKSNSKTNKKDFTIEQLLTEWIYKMKRSINNESDLTLLKKSGSILSEGIQNIQAKNFKSVNVKDFFKSSFDNSCHEKTQIENIDNTIFDNKRTNQKSSDILVMKKGNQTDDIVTLQRKLNLKIKNNIDKLYREELLKRKYVIKNLFTLCDRHKQLYKTFIKKRHSGGIKICCLYCWKLNVPIIRSQKYETVANPIDAACVLACWPFCYLPFFLKAKTKKYPYCSACYYDYKIENMLPNIKEFKK